MENKSSKDILQDVFLSLNDDYEKKYFEFHRYRYEYIMNKINQVGLKEGSKILDVGCYPLHLFKTLKLSGYSVYGISSQHEPIKASNIVIKNIETDRLPYSGGFFDLIIFSEVMEHLIVNPLIYYAKFKNILSETGRVIVTTPNAAGLYKIIPILLGRSTYFPLSDVFSTQLNDGSIYKRHNREYTMNELGEILKQAKFEIKKSAYFSAYRSYLHDEAKGKPFKQTARMISQTVTMLFPRLRDTIYIEASPII